MAETAEEHIQTPCLPKGVTESFRWQLGQTGWKGRPAGADREYRVEKGSAGGDASGGSVDMVEMEDEEREDLASVVVAEVEEEDTSLVRRTGAAAAPDGRLRSKSSLGMRVLLFIEVGM